MQKYAVAYINYFDNDLQMTVVEACNPIAAIVKGVKEIIGIEEDAWVDQFLDLGKDPSKYGEDIEKVKEEFFNTDQNVEVMPI